MKASLTVCLLVLGTGAVPAAEMDKPRLRQLASLPKTSVQMHVSYSNTRGLHLNLESPHPRMEIARLEKQLTVDHGDVESYLRLGDDLFQQGDHKEADRVVARAVALCRQRVKKHPENMRCLAQLGDALIRTRESKKGSDLIEQAVKRAPRDWYTWLMRAEELDSRAFRPVFKKTLHLHWSTQQEEMSGLSDRKLTREQLAEMVRLHKEARRCFDKALALAPREKQVHLARLNSTIIAKVVERKLRAAPGEKISWLQVIYSPEAIAEARLLARICPNDPDVIGTTMIADFLCCVANHKLERTSPASLTDYVENRDRRAVESLPKESRAFFLWSQERLEKLVDKPKPKIAAAAEEFLAATIYLLSESVPKHPDAPILPLKKDPTWKVIEHARRAVRLDPGREQAWELLIAMLWNKDQTAEAIHVARQWIEIKDSAHSRFLLAKLYFDQGKDDRARKELEAGLRIDPRDLYCRLGLIALLLKQEEEAAIILAGELLRESVDEIKRQNKDACTETFMHLCGIQAALSGQADRAGKMFRQILRLDDGNAIAARALAALGQPLTKADRPLASAYLRKNVVMLTVASDRPGAPITDAWTAEDKTTDETLFFLTAFPHLRQLCLFGDRVTDAGLSHLKALPELERLDLYCKGITDQGLVHLKKMTKLRSLLVSCEKISDAGLVHLQGLHKLESLWIMDRRSLLGVPHPGITVAGIARLKKLSHLRELRLSLKVTDKELACLADMTHLRSLTFIAGNLTDTGLSHLTQLTSLEQLGITGSAVTDKGLAHLKKLRHLRELRLSQARITDAGLVHLQALKSLRVLDLSDTQITNAGLAQLRKLNHLHELSLSIHSPSPRPAVVGIPTAEPKIVAKPPRITDAGLKHLKELTRLEKLELDGIPINDEGLLQLSGLKQLRSLNLMRTNVSSMGIAQLKKCLPDLKVLDSNADKDK